MSPDILGTLLWFPRKCKVFFLREQSIERVTGKRYLKICVIYKHTQKVASSLFSLVPTQYLWRWRSSWTKQQERVKWLTRPYRVRSPRLWSSLIFVYQQKCFIRKIKELLPAVQQQRFPQESLNFALSTKSIR